MLLRRYDTASIWRYKFYAFMKTSYNIFLSFSNNFWTKKKFFSLYLLWMAYFVKLEKLSGIRLSFRFSALLHFHKTNSFLPSLSLFSLSLSPLSLSISLSLYLSISLSLYLSISLSLYLSISLSLYLSFLSFPLSLYLSFSLSHTHKHPQILWQYQSWKRRK